MRLRFFAVGFAICSTLGVFGYGCSSNSSSLSASSPSPPEDVCDWIESPTNCYRTFFLDVGDECGKAGFGNAPTGSFMSRDMLDTCILDGGGSITFDTPLDITHFPLGQPLPTPDAGPDAGLMAPDNITFEIIRVTGDQCASGSFQDNYTFSLSINACPTNAGAIPALGMGGGDSGGGMGFEPLVGSSSSTSSTTSGAGGSGITGCNNGLGIKTSKVILSGQYQMTNTGDAIDTTCPSGEQHHFDFLTLEKCKKDYPLMPSAQIDSSPGSSTEEGHVTFRILYPPVNVPDGGRVHGQPNVVEYFNCRIPKAPPECANGVKDGDESDVDCGGAEQAPGCPARCQAGQACKINSDCANDECRVDGTTGLATCNPAVMTTSAAGAGGGMSGAGGAAATTGSSSGSKSTGAGGGK